VDENRVESCQFGICGGKYVEEMSSRRIGGKMVYKVLSLCRRSSAIKQ